MIKNELFVFSPQNLQKQYLKVLVIAYRDYILNTNGRKAVEGILENLNKEYGNKVFKEETIIETDEWLPDANYME